VFLVDSTGDIACSKVYIDNDSGTYSSLDCGVLKLQGSISSNSTTINTTSVSSPNTNTDTLTGLTPNGTLSIDSSAAGNNIGSIDIGCTNAKLIKIGNSSYEIQIFDGAGYSRLNQIPIPSGNPPLWTNSFDQFYG
jgi:hypothetical protein